MTASHSSSVMFTSTRSRRMPALLTSTCRSPNASTAALTRRWPPSQSATLSPLAIASPPIALISSTTCCAGVASLPLPSLAPPRSLTTTLAPSDANSSACSRPMPRPAPVMIATRPSSVPMSSSPPASGGSGNLPLEEDGDPAAALDARARWGIRAHDAVALTALHELEAGGRERVVGVAVRHADDVGDLDEIRALADVHGDGRALLGLLALGGIGLDDLACLD